MKCFDEYYLSSIDTSLVWREFRIHNCQGSLQSISNGLFIVLSIWDWFGIIVGIAILSYLWLATELIVYNGGGYQTECNVPSHLFHNSVVYSRKLVLFYFNSRYYSSYCLFTSDNEVKCYLHFIEVTLRVKTCRKFSKW